MMKKVMNRLLLYILVIPIFAFTGLCIVAIALGAFILSPKKAGSIVREYMEEIKRSKS